MEAERLIEMFNVKVFGKPSSVTVKTVDQPDEKSATTTSEDTTSAYDTETSLFDEIPKTNEGDQPKEQAYMSMSVDTTLIGTIQIPNGIIPVLKSDDGTLYLKAKEVLLSLGYCGKMHYKNSPIGRLFLEKNALAQATNGGTRKPPFIFDFRATFEEVLPTFKTLISNVKLHQNIEQLIGILRREYQQLTKEPLFDGTTEQVTTLEVPATKEINVEVENTTETTAPPPDAKSLLEQFANQTGVDKAIIADAILNDRQSKFDSEQKKLRDLLN